MRAEEPSQTAIASAAFRALHAHYASAAGATPIYDDPFAAHFLPDPDLDGLRESLEAMGFPELPRVCAYFALRHRFAEDRLLAALEHGTRQVVVLGAGLDGFALREPARVASLRYLEVDHPATQGFKLARIEAARLPRPPIAYASIDFERETLASLLEREGIGAGPVFFTWLGVSQYIDRAALLDTLRAIHATGPGSELVLDFILPEAEQLAADRAPDAFCAAGSAHRGEPWISRYSAEPLRKLLLEEGFGNVERLSPEAAAAEYYADQPRDLTPMGGWQLLHLRV